MDEPLLQVAGLSVELDGEPAPVRVLDQISFELRAGQALGIVGETGSGKTLLGLALARLLPEPAARVVAGSVRLGGADLLALGTTPLEALRGRELAVVFQEPMSALDPLIPVGEQIAEVAKLHSKGSEGDARGRAIELLRRLGLSQPEVVAERRPHQLSKGMLQRASIALALAASPRLLLADELTASLDATNRLQVMEVLVEEQRSTGMAMVLITHDLGMVRTFTHEVMVMHGGQLAEWAPTPELLSNAQHPYTHALLAAAETLARPRRASPQAAPGAPAPNAESASPWSWPSGCRYRLRCPRASAECAEGPPPVTMPTPGHRVACYHPGARA